jgi:hypothetical protein
MIEWGNDLELAMLWSCRTSFSLRTSGGIGRTTAMKRLALGDPLYFSIYLRDCALDVY